MNTRAIQQLSEQSDSKTFGAIDDTGCFIPEELKIKKLETEEICIDGDCISSDLWHLLIRFLKFLDKIF